MCKFSKTERLRKSVEFTAVYKSKKYFSKNFFIAVALGEKRRLGITVSSKSGNAVERNKIKRVVREFFRLNKDVFPVGDVIVTAKIGAKDLKNAQIRDELRVLLTKCPK